jgi:hypothetical protein
MEKYILPNPLLRAFAENVNSTHKRAIIIVKPKQRF